MQPYYPQVQQVPQMPQSPVLTSLKNILWFSSLITAATSFVIKVIAMFIIYQSFSINNLTDLLALFGEVKVSLILLAVSLVLDSVAIMLGVLDR